MLLSAIGNLPFGEGGMAALDLLLNKVRHVRRNLCRRKQDTPIRAV